MKEMNRGESNAKCEVEERGEQGKERGKQGTNEMNRGKAR